MGILAGQSGGVPHFLVVGLSLDEDAVTHIRSTDRRPKQRGGA